MARIIKKPGYLFSYPTIDGNHGYCLWLTQNEALFFRHSGSTVLSQNQIMQLPRAFRVHVFGDTPGRFSWKKVGVVEVPANLLAPQKYAMQDTITGKFSLYENGNIRPAEEADVIDLETAAVWSHPHLVERILAELTGKQSIFARSVNIPRIKDC